MKVRIIQTPKFAYGGTYDTYTPSFVDNLGMLKSATGIVQGFGKIATGVSGIDLNSKLDEFGNKIKKSADDHINKVLHPSATTKTTPFSTTSSQYINNTTTPQISTNKPQIPTNIGNSNTLESGNDILLQGLQNGGVPLLEGNLQSLYENVGKLFAQNGLNNGMVSNSNVISVPVMKDGGHTFLTSQPAYTKKSYTYFGTNNAPARDSYTDNNETNTTVKPVDHEIATIEAEKGEYIYSDQGLFKILGEKHPDGGTPLAAKGGEFIFSAHKDMTLSPDSQKELKLKTPPSNKWQDNTPAKILERNVDIKDYNRLKTIVGNPKSDNITKKTAQFMLDKMDAKIKTIASLQEAKKNPNPTQVENQYLEQGYIQKDINQQEQFQNGGMYQNGGNASLEQQQNSDILNEIVKIKDPRKRQGVQLAVNRNPDLPYLQKMELINKLNSDKATGFWDSVFRLQGTKEASDPRLQEAIHKLIPYVGQSEGLWDSITTLLSVPENEINHLLTGNYEPIGQTVRRYHPDSVGAGTELAINLAADPFSWKTAWNAYKTTQGVTDAMRAKQAYDLGRKIKTPLIAGYKAALKSKDIVKKPVEYLSKLAAYTPSNKIANIGYKTIGNPAVWHQSLSGYRSLNNEDQFTKLQEENIRLKKLVDEKIASENEQNNNGVADPDAANPDAVKKDTTTTVQPKKLPLYDQSGQITNPAFRPEPNQVYDEKKGWIESKQNGGLIQYQSGTSNVTPSYYSEPETGLAVQLGEKGVPGLYRNNQNIFNVYSNPNDYTATGKNASFRGNDYQNQATSLSNIVKSMRGAGIDFNDVKTGADFQNKMYGWRLQNDPNSLVDLFHDTGATNNMLKDPALRSKLEQLGVVTGNVSGRPNYTLDFSKIQGDPEKLKQALLLIQPHFPDNYVGYRSLGAKPTPTAPVAPNNPTANVSSVNNNQSDYNKTEVPNLNIKNVPPPQKLVRPRNHNFDIYMGNELAYQDAPLAYTPPEVQPWMIAAHESDQPMKNQASQQLASYVNLGSKLGNPMTSQLSSANFTNNTNDGLHKVGVFNANSERDTYNKNMNINAALVNDFNQRMAGTNLFNKQSIYNKGLLQQGNRNQYISTEDKNSENEFNAKLQTQAAMVNSGMLDPNNKTPIDVANGFNIDPNYQPWNTRAASNSKGSNLSEIKKQVEGLNLPTDEAHSLIAKIYANMFSKSNG
jgi:hypothetical protein